MTKKILRDLYLVRRLSVRQAAVVLGVGATSIRFWLKKHGIKTRSISTAKKGTKPAKHTIEASVRSRRKKPIAGKPTVGYKWRSDGYVYVLRPDHPFVTKAGYVLEHRLVMEKIIGRFLLPTEDVHHINEIRFDNREENLELISSRSEHTRKHYPRRKINKHTGRFV